MKKYISQPEKLPLCRAKARWTFEPACVMQFSDNVKRDKLVKRTLKKQGWKIIEIWECEIKNQEGEKDNGEISFEIEIKKPPRKKRDGLSEWFLRAYFINIL